MNQSVNCVEIWDMFLFLNQFCEYRIDFCINTDGIGPIVLGIVLKSEIRVLPTTSCQLQTQSQYLEIQVLGLIYRHLCKSTCGYHFWNFS